MPNRAGVLDGGFAEDSNARRRVLGDAADGDGIGHRRAPSFAGSRGGPVVATGLDEELGEGRDTRIMPRAILGGFRNADAHSNLGASREKTFGLDAELGPEPETRGRLQNSAGALQEYAFEDRGMPRALKVLPGGQIADIDQRRVGGKAGMSAGFGLENDLRGVQGGPKRPGHGSLGFGLDAEVEGEEEEGQIGAQRRSKGASLGLGAFQGRSAKAIFGLESEIGGASMAAVKGRYVRSIDFVPN